MFPFFLFMTKMSSLFQRSSRVLLGQFSVKFFSSKVFFNILAMKQMFNVFFLSSPPSAHGIFMFSFIVSF